MATTTNFGWETPDDTDLVKDGAAAIRTALGGVDTSFVDLKGGTTGQILSKASNTDLDYTWTTANPGDITGVTAGTGISGGGTSGDVTVSINTAVTADLTTAQTLTNKTLTSPALTTPTISTATTSGDLLYGTGAGALSRLGIGSTSQVLTVAAGIPSWATPSSSGASYSLISSVTASGARVSFTSLTSYNNLFLVFSECTRSLTGTTIYLQINGSTTAADYWQTFFRTNNNATYSTAVFDGGGDVSGGNSNGHVIGYIGTVASKTINGYANIQGAKSSGPKLIPWVGGISTGSTSSSSYAGTNIFNGAAVSSLTIGDSSGTWNGGTIKLYGSTI